MVPLPAPRIPGLTWVGHLASGGYGDVHHYRDEHGRDTAVKVLHDALADRADRLAFEREARQLAGLDHPHVVAVHTFAFAPDGRPYLAMEHCPTRLSDLVREQPLRLAEALRTAVQLASAVDAVHRAGLVHRDVKPGNVLVATDGRPVLADFGIARPHRVVDAGPRGLSLRYVAPEVLRGDGQGDVAADVYSLTATMFTLVVGHPPFVVPGGDNGTTALVGRTLDGRWPGVPPTVPPPLERVLRQGLARSPAERPASASVVGRALQEVQVGLGLRPTSVPLGPSLAADAPTPAPPTPTPPAEPLAPVRRVAAGEAPWVAADRARRADDEATGGGRLRDRLRRRRDR